MKFVIATQFGYFKKVFFKKIRLISLNVSSELIWGSFAPLTPRREVTKLNFQNFPCISSHIRDFTKRIRLITIKTSPHDPPKL